MGRSRCTAPSIRRGLRFGLGQQGAGLQDGTWTDDIGYRRLNSANEGCESTVDWVKARSPCAWISVLIESRIDIVWEEGCIGPGVTSCPRPRLWQRGTGAEPVNENARKSRPILGAGGRAPVGRMSVMFSVLHVPEFARRLLQSDGKLRKTPQTPAKDCHIQPFAPTKTFSDTTAQSTLPVVALPVTIAAANQASAFGTRPVAFFSPHPSPPDLCLLHSVFRI